MSSHTRGITATSLLKQSNRHIIQTIVQKQIKTIDAQILTAHHAGYNYIDYELPVNFSINNMDKADAQTMIYSDILSAYTLPEDKGGKGFTDVYIALNPLPILYIKWLNGMDKEERDQRLRIIREHEIAGSRPRHSSA